MAFIFISEGWKHALCLSKTCWDWEGGHVIYSFHLQILCRKNTLLQLTSNPATFFEKYSKSPAPSAQTPAPLKFRAAVISCSSNPIFNSQTVSPLLTKLHSADRTDSNLERIRINLRVACQKAHYLPQVNNLCLRLLFPLPLHFGVQHTQRRWRSETRGISERLA